MDPGTLMDEASFGNANATSFNLTEIWQFPMNGGGASVAESGGGLGLRMPQFGHNLAQFGNVSGTNQEVSANDLMSLDSRGSPGGGVGCNGGVGKRRNAEDESAKCVSSSSGNGVNDCGGKRLKTSGCKDEIRESKTEAESGSGKPVEQISRPPDPPKQDYIHVRARRGQATDSHSLAERARREKISERMKILQDLVPGCNKDLLKRLIDFTQPIAVLIIGKALVLDEIINYIQSLQRQVEFLSMKLETVNSRMNPANDMFPPKEINLGFQFGQQTFDTSGMAFPSQPTREFSRGSSPEWLHMQVGGVFERTT